MAEDRERPLVAIVSSAEIAEQATLDADYWLGRKPGESAPAYRRRKQAEDAIRRAEGHERHAAHLRAEAAELLAEGEPADPGEPDAPCFKSRGIPPAEGTQPPPPMTSETRAKLRALLDLSEGGQ